MLVIDNVELKAVGVQKEQYPDDDKIEIAFVGRSNVGKSSLINTMINRKALARTSQTPGKTRTINFYEIEKEFYFVDLPGYGYAKVPDREREKWAKMIEEYLETRKQLKAIVLLIDIRHLPTKDDKQMFEWIKYYNFEIIIVLTKSDKLTRNQLNKNISAIKKDLNIINNEFKVIPFSSSNKTGREELWDGIKIHVGDFK